MKKLFLIVIVVQLTLNINKCISQWVQQVSGTTVYMNSAHFESGMLGWITGNSATIRKTTNGGINWVTQNSGQPFGSLNSVFFIDPFTGWIVGDQVNTNTLILKTIDGGNNWTLQPVGGSKIFYSCFFLNPSVGWAVGMSNSYNGLIYYTSDGGLNWSQQAVPQTSRFLTCYFINNNGWAGGINSFASTSNGGLSWDTISSSYIINGLHFVDPMNGYMAENSGKIYKTTNGGLNWNLSYTGSGTMKSVFFFDIAYGWTCGTGGKIYKTSNGGINWAIQTTPVTQDLNSIYFVTPLMGYATGSGGVILKTTNGGESISPSSTLTIHRYNINKPILLNQFTLDTINIVTDNAAPGFTQDVNVYLDTIINNYDYELEIALIHQGIIDTIVYRVGGNGSNFYRTVLNDSAIIPIEGGTPPFVGQYKPSRPLSQFNNLPTTGTWILRIYDRAKKNLSGVIKSWGITVTYTPNIGIRKIQDIIPDRCMLYQNYPNPFNPSTNIKYQITDKKSINLKVFDLLGREVATLVNEIQNPGIYETKFSVNSITNDQLPSGIYLYSLYIDGVRIDTKKFVLIK